MRRYRNKQLPRLETLESRVMLSVGDSPANVPGQVDWDTTIQTSDGSHPEIEVYYDNQAVRITGSGHGNVSVDLSHLSQLLPGVVTLQITSFDSVKLTGEATLRDLVISDVTKADAGHVALDRLFTFGVEYVRIDAAPVQVFLEGPMGANGPTLGDRTLLETDHFSDAPDATIFGNVSSLGLATNSHVTKAPKIGPMGSVLLNFVPDEKQQVADLSSFSEATLIKGGDFARYFFASAAEREAMVKSSAIFLQPALVEHISAASFLGTVRLQALLGEGSFDNTANLPSRPLTDKVNVVPIDIGLRMKLVDADHGAAQVPLPTKVEAWQPPMAVEAGNFPQAPASGDHAQVAVASTPEPVVLSSTTQHEASPLPETALGALSVTLARLSEPFVHAISDLQGRFATFGEIASAQVTEKLRTDGRPALLVDTRSSSATRNRPAEEVIVVNV